MPEYDNSQRGVLFKNDKRTSDDHPAYKGNGEVNGVEVWISAWIKRSAAGKPYMSLAFTNKEGQVVGAVQTTADNNFQGVSLEDDSDIPFRCEETPFDFDLFHGHSNR